MTHPRSVRDRPPLGFSGAADGVVWSLTFADARGTRVDFTREVRHATLVGAFPGGGRSYRTLHLQGLPPGALEAPSAPLGANAPGGEARLYLGGREGVDLYVVVAALGDLWYYASDPQGR